MKVQETLKKCAEIMADREKTHGPIRRSFHKTAAYWSIATEKIVKPEDVAKFMTLLKISRSDSGTLNPDDYIDAINYLAIELELLTEHGEPKDD